MRIIPKAPQIYKLVHSQLSSYILYIFYTIPLYMFAVLCSQEPMFFHEFTIQAKTCVPLTISLIVSISLKVHELLAPASPKQHP